MQSSRKARRTVGAVSGMIADGIVDATGMVCLGFSVGAVVSSLWCSRCVSSHQVVGGRVLCVCASL